MIDRRAALSGNREGSGWSSGGASGLFNASGAPGTLDTLTTSNTASTSNTSNTSTTSSNGASQHAHQLLQIACASACRSTGFDAATPAAVALFAEVAAARLAGLARAAAAASVFTGVASMKPESAPSTSSSYSQSSSLAQSESHSTSNPHSLSHSSNSLACSNSVSSHASSLLLLLSCTRTSGSSTLLGADADLLDTDALLALRRLVLAGALSASAASGAEKDKDKEKERDSDREKAATLPLPSIPLVSLDVFPRVKPVSFPVPTPVAPLSISLHSSVPANQSHLPSPTLSSSLDMATSIEQKSSDSHLQPPKSLHLPVNASATATAGVHNDSLIEVQTGEDNLNDSDSESDLASEDEDEDNSNPSAATTSAARKQSRQESSSSRRKNRKGRSSRSSRVHHPYLLPVDLKEGIPAIDGTLQAHFKGNPSLPSFLTSTTSGSQSSDSVHRKMFTAIPIPFKNYPNDASSSSSSKPVSLPPTKPPATSRDLHQHALRTMLHPAAAPTTTFLSSNANMQHSLGASLSERQMLLRGTAVTLGAGVGASGGGGEGSGGVESLWGYAGVGGGGGGGGLLEGLMNSKGLSVKTHQSVFAGPTPAASSMVGGSSDGQGIKSGGIASNSTGGGNSTGGSGMMMGGGSILGGIGTDLMRNNSMHGNSSGGSPSILPGAKGGLGSGMQRTQPLPLGYQMSGSSGSGIGRMGGSGGGVGPGANGGASLGSGATSFGGGSGGGGAESGGSSSGNTGGTKIKFKLSVNK
ncbi:hypothetical protein HDU77_005351 [Chytriomyces hyalinus]|nr:hypothetical protein HDU77_005351 [Chytriomyces hyalinus]